MGRISKIQEQQKHTVATRYLIGDITKKHWCGISTKMMGYLYRK
jgi:hypothetical protein